MLQLFGEGMRQIGDNGMLGRGEKNTAGGNLSIISPLTPAPHGHRSKQEFMLKTLHFGDICEKKWKEKTEGILPI